MIEKIERCLCDICHKEGAKTYHTLTYRTFDSTDGMTFYNPPQIKEEEIDLCDICARKATNIHSVGVQCDQYDIDDTILTTPETSTKGTKQND